MKIRVVCPSCKAIYNVPEERVTAPVVHASCKVCSGRVEIRRADAETTEADAVQEDKPTRPQVFSPIPQEPEDRETGNWQHAIIDNTEAEQFVSSISEEGEGTIPPKRERNDLDPESSLGSQTITSTDDIGELFPEANPQPPAELRPAPADSPTEPRPTDGSKKKKKKKRRRRSGSRVVPLLLLMFALSVAIAAAVYLYRDRIISLL